MARPNLTDIQILRAQIFHHRMKVASELSEGEMDMLFRDPSKTSPDYLDRRRIFNRMKHGYMPYKDQAREDFLLRIANHGGKGFFKPICDEYNSLIWDTVNSNFTPTTNRQLLYDVLETLANNQQPLTPWRLASNAGQSRLQGIPYAHYSDYFAELVMGQEFSVDALLLLSCMYKDAMFNDKFRSAEKLKKQYQRLSGFIFLDLPEFRVKFNELVSKPLLKLTPDSTFKRRNIYTDYLGQKPKPTSVAAVFLKAHEDMLTYGERNLK